MAVNPQFKINQIAKDLGKKSKDIQDLLIGKGFEVKNTQKSLEAIEFDVLFDTLTKENQIVEIENYLDGITYIPSKAKKVVAEPAKAEEKPAEPAKEAVAEPKTEKKEEKPQAKAAEPKVEAPAERKPASLESSSALATRTRGEPS
jgi:hypothetical protein